MPPNSYAEAVEQSARAVAQARLSDPDEHFPYRHAAVIELLDQSASMGPGIPGGADGTSDTSRTIDDYMTRAIAAASAEFVDAQAAWLGDPTDPETLAAYRHAQDELQAARLDHRRNRESGFTVGAAARRAG